MIMGLIELGLVGASGYALWRDSRNNFTGTKRLYNQALIRLNGLPMVQRYLNSANRQVRLIDGAVDGLRQKKSLFEEKIGAIEARADLFEKKSREALFLSAAAYSKAEEALKARQKADGERRDTDAEHNDRIYNGLIAVALSQNNIAKRFLAGSTHLRAEAGKLKNMLMAMSIQLEADGAQAEEAKADIAVAEGFEVFSGFLGGNSEDPNGNTRRELQKMFDSSFLRRRTGQHLLEIRRAAIGDPQPINDSINGQVYFSPEVLREAKRFEEQHLLTGPTTENQTNQDGDS